MMIMMIMMIGVSKKSMNAINLDEDWDPEKYDQEMEQMFNDDYFDGGRQIWCYLSLYYFSSSSSPNQ